MKAKITMRSKIGVVGLFAFALTIMGSSAAVSGEGNYFNSYDGKTGAYFNLSWTFADLDDIEAKTQSGVPPRSFNHDLGHGGLAQFGYDFGKIRFDWRMGAVRADVDDIGGLDVVDDSTSVLGYSTLNLTWDIYRFGPKKGLAATPCIGGGGGVAGAWTNGKRLIDADANGILSRDKFDVGVAITGEAGIMLDLWKGLGLTLAYNWMFAELGDKSEMQNHLFNAGMRYTF